MKKMTNNSGFTLLEIIIVIIIVGVLASLALPRFFSTVEYSRSTEALTAIATIRQSIERCYLQSQNGYADCTDFDTDLDIEDPQDSPGAHFTYLITPTAAGYQVIATRNNVDNGDGIATITVEQDATTVTRSGTEAFESIK